MLVREVEEKAYKQIPLDILLDVSDFCIKNNIRYSLAFGTLIGAIRHRGFIPWDDDIDIVMPRIDYERFKRIYHSERYILSDLECNEHHPTDMAKIYDVNTYYFYKGYIKRNIGLFIDVFVVDNYPLNSIERDRWIKNIKRYARYYKIKNIDFINLFSYSKSARSLFTNLAVKILPVSKKFLRNKINSLSIKYNNENTGLVGITMCTRGNAKYAFPQDFFNHFVDIEFEGHTFKAIKHFDKWLKTCYGNYMELPPEEQRISIHGIKAFYKNNSNK